MLDRLMPDWKARAIPGKTALEALLEEAMMLESPAGLLTRLPAQARLAFPEK